MVVIRMVAPWMVLFVSSSLLSLHTCASKISGVQHKVKCDTAEMTVEMVLPDTVTDVYLEGMKEYGKDIGCQPMMEGNTASFRLSIAQFYRCGMTKVVDHTNGHRVYYHRIVVESDSHEKESIVVKCGWMPHHPERHRAKRQGELSPDFQEDEEYDITVIEGRAPEPILGIAVRQNGQLVGSDLNVQPGTLLQMEVFLDPNSTSTYGLRVSYMDVTDQRTKEETIILNGCSVDPYLFENFNTVDGDTLTARFRAFKFPETNFVLFRGTIDVCLDRCSGVECSNDQLAFGRKRRAASQAEGTAKLDRTDRVFEVSMTTLVKFDSETGLQKDILESNQAKGVDTVEQPIQAQQSQSILNESEPSSKASPPQQPSHQTEPQPEPEPSDGSKKASTSLAVKMNSTPSSLVLSVSALLASLLYNKY